MTSSRYTKLFRDELQPTDATKEVYVFGFSPDYSGSCSVGGFEWRTTWAAAKKELLASLEGLGEHDGCNYTLCAVPVPAGLSAEEITTYLDERMEWFEPSLPTEEESTDA